MKKKRFIILLVLLITVVVILGSYILYREVYFTKKNLNIKLKGEKNITLKYKDVYKEEGAIADFRGKNINNIIISGNVNTNKVGEYNIKYKEDPRHERI